MFIWLMSWILILVTGIALLLLLYAQLLRSLKKHNPMEYVALGSPTLFMYSPSRSIRLQKFIYVGSRKPNIHPNVYRLCQLLGILTPVFVALVFGVFFWGMCDFITSYVT